MVHGLYIYIVMCAEFISLSPGFYDIAYAHDRSEVGTVLKPLALFYFSPRSHDHVPES
jgi:hypothetical protein